MAFEPTPSAIALVTAVLVSVPFAYFVWGRLPRRSARPLLAVLVFSGLWAVSLLIAFTSSEFGVSKWWLHLSYTWVGVATLSWLVFALEYTGRSDLIPVERIAVLGGVPAVVSLLAWTSGVQSLVWDVRSNAADPMTVEVSSFGVVHWVYAVYLVVLVAVGSGFLLLTLHRASDPDPKRVALVGTGALAPILGILVSGTNVVRPDPAPAGFVAAGAVFTYAVFRFELMNLTPVAHNTMVDDMRDGVFVLDEEDRVIDINPTAKRILGIDADRAVGRHAREILSVYPGLYERYADIDEIQEEIGLDDGQERRFFHIQVSPLYDARDRRVGRLFLVHDITNQKRRQQELQRQNQRLDQFASLVSHDLRNPLNVADGYIEIMQETDDTRYLDEVENSLDRMGDLIDDVLTLAREGQTITETTEVEVGGIAREAWGNVDTPEASLSVESSTTVEASHKRLLRVLENLFRNAIEHGRDDVEVRVGMIGGGSFSQLPPERRGFFVEDDGPGIPEDQRDDVLEDGFTTSEEGTGLGLSIVSSIVEAHGWTIQVAESDDGGARFEITGVEPAEPGQETRAARADGD